LVSALFFLSVVGADAQLVFDKTSHNFGKIMSNAGEQRCEFTYTNKGNQPVAIITVISSCGCTTPSWSNEPVRPGQSGKIKVTYSNDEGPYPFEKNISVYVSYQKKPIILSLSGVVVEKNKSLKEIYPAKLGMLGVMSNRVRLGQLASGTTKSKSVNVANISSKSVKISFAAVPAGVSVKAVPSELKPNQIAEIQYTVTASQNGGYGVWGNSDIPVRVLCNGVEAKEKFLINLIVLDDFSKLSKEEKNKAPMVLAKESSADIESLKSGKPEKVSFKIRNTGYSELLIRSIQCDAPSSSVSLKAPESVAPGVYFNIDAQFKREGLPAGENVFTITFTTNSPQRPIVNLFVSVHCE